MLPLHKFTIYKVKYLLCFVFIIFSVGVLISLYSLPQSQCICNPESLIKKTINSYEHKLGIIVPFRDRFEELLEFVPHMDQFLSAQNLHFKIFVINQVDQYRFNRASLINVGYLIAIDDGCDYIAMHDVDLLPLNPNLSYQYPSTGLFHIASPELHPRYHYANFVGGILLVKKIDFEILNGMSNKYWGWGLEDDEFYVRVKEAAMNISRPINITTGIENTFKHVHDRVLRKRDMTKCFNQREVTRRRDRQTGLRDVAYVVQSHKQLNIDGAPVTVINVALKCNRTVTPWCLCSEENKVSKISKSAKKQTDKTRTR
uniref:Beta-1,4-N-acetylgalactosaminyltransferase n=1 Tax=Clastoptera arizonana TaxID=38151 RepID=A0A1B6CJ92_9HEMI